LVWRNLALVGLAGELAARWDIVLAPNFDHASGAPVADNADSAAAPVVALAKAGERDGVSTCKPLIQAFSKRRRIPKWQSREKSHLLLSACRRGRGRFPKYRRIGRTSYRIAPGL
jgi:hypothetical protein